MLACRIHAKEDLRIEPIDMPEVGPGQVLLRLGAGGICGSDLHYYFEGRNGSFVVREPLIPGHEASAVVAGDRRRRHARQGGRQGRGQPVARLRAMRLLPRGPRAAVPQHALPRQRQPVTRTCRACSSEYFVMGERQCYPVAGDVSLGELAFARAAGGRRCTRVNRGGDLLGKSVLITGAGTIGCLTVMAARLAGARKRHRHRRPRPAARAGARASAPTGAARRPRRRRAARRRSSTSATRSPAASPR